MVKEEDIDINIIEDLLCRFIVNLPKDEQTTDRLFFHIQAAHWFYSDFYVNNSEIIGAGCKVPPCNFKVFSKIIFKHCPFLKPYFEYFEIFYQRFSKYISQIPVLGAIILNSSLDKILLVTNYKNTLYSFPKGKINQNETGIECAVREVWEETGIDISKLISEKDFIEFKMGGNKAQKMYVVCGVDENTFTRTNTRCEIGRIDWVPLTEIEESKNTAIFNKILPYMRPLKLWIRDFISARTKEREGGAVFEQIIEMSPPPTEPMSKPLMNFVSRLDELGRDFERRIMQEQAEVEKEKDPNPFLMFKLDRNSLKDAFAV